MINAMASVFPMKRLKYVVSLRRSRVDGGNSDRPYVGLENVESWTGRLVGDVMSAADRSKSASPEGAALNNTFELGDILFGKLRPYLAKAWVAMFSGRSTTEFLVMQPVEAEPRFLRYVFVWRDFVDAVDASTFGSRMPRADWDYIGSLPVPVPILRLQRSIADYLDRETARIDALIVEKERVLGLLAEKRRALVSRAVTGGLDPTVPLRESGILWAGKIPSHWGTQKIAWLFRQRDQRGEPELPLLEVSINAGVILREFSGERIESTAADFNTYKIARSGDVVFNKMRMWQGAVGMASEDGLVSPDYVVASPRGSLSARYAELLFRTDAFSAECARRSHGIVWDRLRLYWDGFRDIRVPLPSLQEQTAIVAQLDRQTAKLNKLKLSTELTISLLRERRSALITAAVTGQIDVESAA